MDRDYGKPVRKNPTDAELAQKQPSKALDSKRTATTGSSVSFDSGTDVGYKSGDLDSGKIAGRTVQQVILERSPSVKSEQSIRFDSGLGSDVFSPLSSECDIRVEGEDDPKAKKSTSETQSSKSSHLWQDIYGQDKDGDTLLHLAVIEARSDVIFPLIRHAPHPDFLDICNDLCQTPLHLCTLTGKSNIVRRLVAAGATLDIQDHHGNTALHIAARNGDLDCVRALLEPLTSEEIQDCKCLYNIYTQFYDLSHLINQKNYNGQTSFHLAAMGGFKKVLECLYDHGANVNDKEGKSGKTALHYAVENMNFELVRILVVKCRANVNVKNYAGKTPIQVAWTLYKTNRHEVQHAVFEFLKKNTSEKWESPSDSECSSDEMSESSEGSPAMNCGSHSTSQK